MRLTHIPNKFMSESNDSIVPMGRTGYAIQQGVTGHPDLAELSSHKLNTQISKKVRENILSGRFYPETDAERRMLREHRASIK